MAPPLYLLQEVDIRSPPPPGLRPLALVNLYGVWLYVSGEAMCQVLQAAPKLETFHFKVRPPAVADTAPGVSSILTGCMAYAVGYAEP